MNLEEILAPMGGLGALAKQVGLNEQQAAAGANALLPGLLQAFQQQSGNTDLSSLLGKMDLGSLAGQLISHLGNQGGSTPSSALSFGNNILAEILGSKDNSRSMAQDAAAASGLDVSQLKSLLPVLATMVAGFMGRNAATGGAGSGLESMISGQLSNALGGILKKFI